MRQVVKAFGLVSAIGGVAYAIWVVWEGPMTTPVLLTAAVSFLGGVFGWALCDVIADIHERLERLT